ncbi:MAG: hypothetical protein INR73_03340 [Williamsia sp.]|nr:hypothetical protein [Williamsia sp.]
MKVIINEREYEWVSDYPEGWMFNSRHYFKCPVVIGRNPCFVKRFEMDGRQRVAGWNLLMKLKYKNEPHLPRTFDIVQTEENRREVYYLFHEYVNGSTLKAIIKDSRPVDLTALTDGLFNALSSVHRNDAWFPDFCEKNIFADRNGKWFLIDLDSCQPASTRPSNDMDVNMVYWALVYKFYKEIMGVEDLKVADVPGRALNYLQLVFLVLHLKVFSLRPSQEYMSDQAFDELPSLLDALDPRFRQLFLNVLQGQADGPVAYPVEEIRELVVRKIVQLNRLTMRGETSLQAQHDGYYSTTAEPVAEADDVELQEARQANTSGRGPVDESRNKRQDQSEAGNKQEPVTILQKGPVQPPPIIVQDLPGLKHPRTRALLTGSVAALVAVILLWFFLYRGTQQTGPSAQIIDFLPKTAYMNSPVAISGKHIPRNSQEIKVFFNRQRGNISYLSSSLIVVALPKMDELDKPGSDSLRIRIAVIIAKDTIRLPALLTVKKK